jgi:Methionyl-tRNA synthetase
MAKVLYVLAETIRCLGLYIQPVMPSSADKLLAQLSVPESERSYSTLSAGNALKPGTPLPKPEGIFPRMVEEENEAAAS